MSLAAVLFLTAAPVPAASAEAYPAAAVLAAFGDGCRVLDTVQNARAQASRGGWTEVEPAADSAIARIVAFGKAAISEDVEATIIPGATFARTVAGRELFLVVSGVRYDDIVGNGCRLYDLSAAAPLPDAAVEAWIGRPANDVSQPGPGLSKSVWNPGFVEGQMEFEASHVAQDAKFPLEAPVSDWC